MSKTIDAAYDAIPRKDNEDRHPATPEAQALEALWGKAVFRLLSDAGIENQTADIHDAAHAIVEHIARAYLFALGVGTSVGTHASEIDDKSRK